MADMGALEEVKRERKSLRERLMQDLVPRDNLKASDVLRSIRLKAEELSKVID